MEDTYTKSAGGQDGVDGPDLGFLGLSPDVVGSLKAASDFFDFDKYSDQILSHQGPKPGFDAVLGMIAEKSRVEFSGMTAKSFFSGEH